MKLWKLSSAPQTITWFASSAIFSAPLTCNENATLMKHTSMDQAINQSVCMDELLNGLINQPTNKHLFMYLSSSVS